MSLVSFAKKFDPALVTKYKFPLDEDEENMSEGSAGGSADADDPGAAGKAGAAGATADDNGDKEDGETPDEDEYPQVGDDGENSETRIYVQNQFWSYVDHWLRECLTHVHRATEDHNEQQKMWGAYVAHIWICSLFAD